MARDPKTLRKAYEYKLGKDLASKLSDTQIKKLSQYYNSLSAKEQSKVDSDLIAGKGDFLDVARGMAEGIVDGEVASVSEADKKKFTKKEDKVPEGLDDLLNDIKKEIDEKVPEGLDDLLNDIKKEIDEKVPEGLDDLLNDIKNEVEEKVPEGLDDLLNDIKNEVEEIKEDNEKVPEGLDDLLNEIQKEVKETKSKTDNIPEGLDELLDEIRKEDDKSKEQSKPLTSSTLTVYKGKKDDDLVEEEIDEKILNLLGLEDVFDLDYGTYATLLKASIVENKDKIPAEELAILSNERKRIRDKVGRFKVKGKKINAETFKKTKKPTAVKVDTKKLLPAAKIKSEDLKEEVKEDTTEQLIPLSDSLSDIEKNLAKILELNQKRLDLEKTQAKTEAREQEKAGATQREERLEGDQGKRSVTKIQRVLAPAKGLIDTIIDFFKNILFGGAIQLLLDVIKDPGKYLRGIIDFINGFITKIDDLFEWMYDTLILGTINQFIGLANSIITTIEDTINDIANKVPFFDPITLGKIDPIDTTLDQVPNLPQVPTPQWAQQQEGGGTVLSNQENGFGTIVNKIFIPQWAQQQEGGGTVLNIDKISFTNGGKIGKDSGITITGMGRDTQLIAAQPGEIMMSKKAVDKYGAENLLGANEAAGGTNQPKFGKFMGFEGGGLIGVKNPKGFSPGKGDRSKKIFLHWTASSYNSDYGAYHTIFQGDGTPIRKGDYGVDRGGHTGGANSNSVGLSIASMQGATPNNFGKYPPTQAQLKAMAAEAAALAVNWGWSKSDVDKNVMTHGEWERYAVANGLLSSPVQRWDLDMLKQGDPVGSGGKALRAMIKSYMDGMEPTSSVQASSSSPVAPGSISRGSSPSSGTQSIRPPIPLEDLGSLYRKNFMEFVGQGGQKSQGSSGSSASQKRVPSFSAEDLNNDELIVVKSIYNIVG
jgi:hypothetical protein